MKMGQLQYGHTFNRVGQTGDWHQILLDDEYGYIYMNGTMPANNPFIPSANQNNLSFTTKNNSNVYDNSTGKLILIGSIQKGENYHAISRHGDWMKVYLAGRIGFIHIDGIILTR